MVSAADTITNNVLSLYSDPWTIMAVMIAFASGLFSHVLLRAYRPKMRRVTVGVTVWATQIVVGYIAAFYLIEDASESRHAVITGLMSIALYYGLLYASVRFKCYRVATFLSLRKAEVVDGEVEFGETIQFLRKK